MQWEQVLNDPFDALAYYMRAVRLREEEHIPLIGLSLDRRQLALMAKLLRSDTVKSYTCLCCAQVHTYVRNWTEHYKEKDTSKRTYWDSSHQPSPIQHYAVRDSLWKWIELHPEAFNDNFNLKLFTERYASDNSEDGNPFLHSKPFAPENTEWQCFLKVPTQRDPVRILCCPEDIHRGISCRHERHILCGDCQIPLCRTCNRKGWSRRYNYRIPMALANDNFLGYTTDILTKYKVRWLEAAIVSPCWTSIIIYYVEGDHGHLFNEEMGNQKCRTVVRGSCASYWMPWEDILEALKRNCSDRNLEEIPLPQECVKYMLRVHLQVRGIDMKKYLKQLMVRPFVLIALLDYLIGQNHEVFRGKGTAEELRDRMRRAVEREYPETEANKPEADRIGEIPASVATLLSETQGDLAAEENVGSVAKKRRYITEKNATPGDGARSVEACLEDIRPHAICVDRSAAAASDPQALREGDQIIAWKASQPNPSIWTR